MSPADELRAAAKVLRETASKATPGPWTLSRIPGVGGSVDDPTLSFTIPVGTQWTSYADGRWIALASPALAEPLAAWLNDHAELYEDVFKDLDERFHARVETNARAMVENALAVARTILGRTQ